jgi:hypothetical protein
MVALDGTEGTWIVSTGGWEWMGCKWKHKGVPNTADWHHSAGLNHPTTDR